MKNMPGILYLAWHVFHIDISLSFCNSVMIEISRKTFRDRPKTKQNPTKILIKSLSVSHFSWTILLYDECSNYFRSKKKEVNIEEPPKYKIGRKTG
jgi:hypothetical protein